MARIRTIKPEFFRHEGLQDLEAENPGKHTMLVFAGLWGHCDKAGRFEWKPRTLKLDILPFLDFDMADTMLVLHRAGFLRFYSHEGREYGEIASFEKHQRIGGKEAQEPGKCPEPIEYIAENRKGSNGEATGKQQGLQEGKGREEEGKGREWKGNMSREANPTSPGEQEKANAALRARREQVAAVFDFWRSCMGHQRAALDDKRKRLIEARLKDGYTTEALCKAISGCSKSAFHMGLNDRGAKYDGLDLILRDAAKVDQFIGYDDNPPKPQGKQAHVEAINRSVVDEFVNGSSRNVIDGDFSHA